MPKRRILFGIGMGMVISCLAFYFVYTSRLPESGELRADSAYGNGREAEPAYVVMTDDEIIERAMELGMRYAHLESGEIDEIEEIDESEEIDGIGEIDQLENGTDAAFDNADGLVTVRIPEGITATQIAQILKNSGVIESASDFVRVLIEKGYTQRMARGTFRLVPGTDYEVLAEMMVSR
ncbi:MAG: endolytic transglycosylase MltG [Defluviitaleaceae bacterium]|nr:endolytic transglycosylase MltG [Defluviitaleaceae bacterium]MCL2835727.1 endolytic transglycosylase MltG [Defluviitaleaceae bacterium]